MDILTLDHISKSFGNMTAVSDLSFSVQQGEIFALLGPNGAGKTTSIRMMLDILRPDSGTITLFGEPINQTTKDRIGYLPEERGLYRELPVIDCLAYLGTLKGMGRGAAKKRAEELLVRVGLEESMRKKVRELSRGMQQKAQFTATIMHDPDLMIIDEPFSGLDPVNTLLIKELMYEMQAAGKTVIMSTHMMHQVEEMAGRMLMMNKGRKVLYGEVSEIRRQYASHAVYLEGDGAWATLPGVERVTFDARKKAELVHLAADTTADMLLQRIATNSSMRLTRFEIALPSLDDIFINVAGTAVKTSEADA